jgi:hypothetical protein
MDPYLESNHWTSFQTLLANAIAIELTRSLKPRYVALPTERYYYDSPEFDIANSVEFTPFVVESGADFPLLLATVLPHLVPHANVEIRSVPDRKVITAIEILSPTTKRGRGRRQYLSRRNRLLTSSSHLIEIDLALQGKHVPMVQPLPNAPYLTLVSRREKRPITEVWPIALRDHLPVVPVPLKRGESDICFDLQKVVAEIYDRIGFDLSIDYAQPLGIALTTEIETWADQLLRKAGKRP